MKLRSPLLAQSFTARQIWPVGIDLALFAMFIAGAYGVAELARYWWGTAVPAAHISQSPWALPLYAFYSLARMFAAYLLSLVFAVVYGYIAAKRKQAEPVLIAILDILQSIPVLSFLPGVMLAMISLFPSRQLGIELGSIILIFTGQVWNMAFSFYSSMKSIPRELYEVTSIYGYNAWQRFIQLELPYGAIGLLWNSMVSVAGGWFFLMACEMFALGSRDFRLPGLGSYLQTAASAGDIGAICWGLAAMIAIIVLIDQLIWRPLIAWSDKFKFEQVETLGHDANPVLKLIRSSRLAALAGSTIRSVSVRVQTRLLKPGKTRAEDSPRASHRAGIYVAIVIALLLAGFAVTRTIFLLAAIPASEWQMTLERAGFTFLRVNTALLIAAAWTIPAGVAIGFNPKLARLAQPLAQIAASVPATALFPVLLLALIQAGGGMGIASILLMLLGTQWYILFNVIAGAMAIPSEFREVGSVFGFSRRQQWRTIILPGIFPYLVTGLITASGGAWNASIVAEYFHLKGQTFATEGLGAQISAATDAGKFDLLLLSTIVMAAIVVSINRLVWRRLYRVSEARYRLEA
ncbi:MAG TPA: ABC transporter permease subunit [Bryobacteraceae bacterium]|nr:ABC transporter permease subunit [Bryobacteraceae bacterium]